MFKYSKVRLVDQEDMRVNMFRGNLCVAENETNMAAKDRGFTFRLQMRLILEPWLFVVQREKRIWIRQFIPEAFKN